MTKSRMENDLGAREPEKDRGWAMRHASKPARVADEDSETPYMTRRAMDYMLDPDGNPVLIDQHVE